MGGWEGMEMNRIEEEQTAFERGVVVPKRNVEEENEDCNCVEVLVDEFTKVGLIVERVQGFADEFIKVIFYFVSLALLQSLLISDFFYALCWYIRFTLWNIVESYGIAQESSFLCGSWMWLTRKLNYFNFRMNPHVCVCMYVHSRN